MEFLCRGLGALHGYFFLGELSEAERAQAWSEVKFGAWQAEPYTEAAIAGRADWDPLDNFATRCEPEGMPRIMMNPNPFEFVNQGSEITLRSQLYAVDRTIHLDRPASPEDAPASSLGYSLGHWEGNTLVVETTHVNWPWLDNNGTPQSEAVEFVERFSVSTDQTRLDYRLTVTDPATFSEPAVYERYWVGLVGATIRNFDCQIL